MYHNNVVKILLRHGMIGVLAKVSDMSTERAITNPFDVVVTRYDSTIKRFIDEDNTEWVHAIARMQISSDLNN